MGLRLGFFYVGLLVGLPMGIWVGFFGRFRAEV